MESLGLKAARLIDARQQSLAATIVSRYYAQHPTVLTEHGEVGRGKCVQDVAYHLAYLSDAMLAEQPALFADYVAWAKALMVGLKLGVDGLRESLLIAGDVLAEHLPSEEAGLARRYLEVGLQRLPSAPAILPSFFLEGEPLSGLAQGYLQALLLGERHRASRLILNAAESGVDVRDIYLHVFQRCQREVGRLWQMNQISVAQEHYCTAATQLIMSQLYPRIFSGERKGYRMVATCVGQELHEIGMRMVADFMELDGWDTYYLGANAPIAGIVQALEQHKADVLGISATMTFHVRHVRNLISAVRGSEAGRSVRVMVGGYPFNVAPDLWRQVGADAYAADAGDAVKVAGALV